jgi:quercetin dioxygenase-like cupin family protein/proteasome lid subunit RPN8/RPN11
MRLLPLLAILAALAPPQEKPVPVDEEPHHQTVLKNDYLQVFRVRLAPGESSLMHVHSHDDGAVRLSDATVTDDVPGQPTGPPEVVSVGAVSARTNEPRPLAHRVNNIGSTPFDVIDVQVLKRPDGPEGPAMGAPAAENHRMRIYRYDLAPGSSSALHTHQRPYLIVAVTDTNLRMTLPDGGAMVHPVKAGDLHWVDTTVTHALANDGTERGILVEFELK